MDLLALTHQFEGRGDLGAEKGSENGVGLQELRKAANVIGHGGMPQAIEAKGQHFVQGLIGGPVIKSDAIRGNKDAGAVFSEMAVNENPFSGIAAKEGKELRDLLIAGSGPATDRKMNEADSQGFGLLAFPINLVGILAAKIDDGGDAEFLELQQTFRVGLRAAI